MRTVLAATAFLLLLTIAPAGAEPGQYWLDMCHDTGAVPIIQESTGFQGDARCSADPWVQGYGGTGVEAWTYVEVVVYNPAGEAIVYYHDGVRPTGLHWGEAGEGRLTGSVNGSQFILDIGDIAVDTTR